MEPVPAEVTRLLVRYSDGDGEALEELLPHVYRELHRLAESYMRREHPAHTLQPTALVHEAYFRLIDQRSVQWKNRSHFYGVAAQLMRRILIDHARQRLAAKRGGHQARVTFDDVLHGDDRTPDLIDLDDALKKLAEMDERQARIVELRYFGGLGIEEVAEVLGTSPATVKRDWTLARTWLFRELSGNEPPAEPS